ncbi:MAG: hypothetical protein ABI395_02325 [Sphingobium sp.]
MIKLSKRVKTVIALPLLFPLLGALNTLVDESHNMILPDGGSVQLGTVVSVSKGGIFYRQPLGRSHVASLASEVQFSFLGQNIMVQPDEQLIQSQVWGTTAGQLSDNDKLYCSKAVQTGKKRTVGLSEIGAVGMDLDAIAKLRYVRTQTCLIDDDGDGTVDRAFVADTSNRETALPVKIAPTSIVALGVVRMPGESEARMIFNGASGLFGTMTVSFQIVEEGKILSFGNGIMDFGPNSFPHAVEISGGKFTILSYDPRQKVAQIRVDKQFTGGDYAIHTEIRSRPY